VRVGIYKVGYDTRHWLWLLVMVVYDYWCSTAHNFIWTWTWNAISFGMKLVRNDQRTSKWCMILGKIALIQSGYSLHSDGKLWIHIAANLCFKLVILWNARCRQWETCNALSNMDVLNSGYIELSLVQNLCPSHNRSWCLLTLVDIYDISSYFSVANVFATLYL